MLALADGLLLTGGGDVDPASYGAAPENVDDPDPGADEWELALIAAARERAVPTLTICRGAQLLAVAHGGRLSQRLSAGDGHRELGGLAPEAILAARHASSSSPARGFSVRSAARSGSPSTRSTITRSPMPASSR